MLIGKRVKFKIWKSVGIYVTKTGVIEDLGIKGDVLDDSGDINTSLVISTNVGELFNVYLHDVLLDDGEIND